MPKTINEFRGKYFFLSNFYSAPVTVFSHTFQNNEAAFQSAKCPERMASFENLPPNEAKRAGRHVPLRNDWEQVKYDVMYQVVKAKFEQNPNLKAKLLATGDAELIEGNNWHDTTWGMCNGKGQNHLGKTLMRVRNELSKKSEVM